MFKSFALAAIAAMTNAVRLDEDISGIIDMY